VGARVRSGTVRRAPILLVLAAVLAAAIVLNDTESTKPATATIAAPPDAGPVVPASDALSTSWYCAEGTSTPDGRADETVVVASVADRALDATVTVVQGSTAAPVSRTYHLRAREQRRVHLSDLVQATEPGVIVEVVGGAAVVTHEIVAEGDVAIEPCARGGAADWYFAAGTTLKGAQQFLVLFDPFGDDALVDITFLTDDGVQEPDALQGLSIGPRSRVSVAVHDQVPRQRDVAVRVHARTGRVVVERSQLFDGTASEGETVRKGIALSLGANAPTENWYFGAATTSDGTTGAIAVANFGSQPTPVEVGVALEGATVAVRQVNVPARSVVTVDRAAGLPPDSPYAISVAARDAEGRGEPVVAELLEWRTGSSAAGASSTMGSTRLARRWVVATVPSGGMTVSVMNPGREVANAELLVYDAGDTTGPPSAPGRSVEPGRLAVFDVDGIGAGGNHVLVVSADRPVAVGIGVTAPDGIAASAAIPDVA
jgi:Family of unknown function (DUF5719)